MSLQTIAVNHQLLKVDNSIPVEIKQKKMTEEIIKKSALGKKNEDGTKFTFPITTLEALYSVDHLKPQEEHFTNPRNNETIGLGSSAGFSYHFPCPMNSKTIEIPVTAVKHVST